LARRSAKGQTDPVNIQTGNTFSLIDDDDDRFNLKSNSSSKVREETRDVKADGACETSAGVTEFDFQLSVDDRNSDMPDRIKKMLSEMKGLSIIMNYSPNGEVTMTRNDFSRLKTPGYQSQLEQYATNIRDPLELTSIPLPGAVNPGQTWKSTRRMGVTAVEGYQPGQAEITYTYLGTRQYAGREVAVVTAAGDVKGVQGSSLKGKVSGSALVDVASGRVVKANMHLDIVCYVSLGFGIFNQTMAANGHVEIKLVRGN
jgi:hypothetical protein